MMARYFSALRAIDLVVLVVAHHRHVGRHLEHFELVDVHELVGLGERRAGHAGELLVHAEVVLEGDRGERLVLRLDRLVLLGLQRLVQAFRIAPARHHAAGELVDDDDLAVAHDVVLVALEQLVRAQRLVDVVHDRDVLDVVERFALEQAGVAQQLLHLLHAGFGQVDGALLLVDLVVGLVELEDVGVDGVVEFGAVVERAGDDQRRARLVDQDRVHLVDDGEDVPALDHVLQPVLHVVAQIVEAELVVGAVGDVAVVGLLALLVVEPVHDDADGQPEEVVDLAHPLGVALGEVVVDGDDMHAAAGERVEIDRQRRDQRLAFAGLHLGDLAFVQDHAADQLHVEMALAERALGRLAHGGEGRHQDVVERLAVGDLRLEVSVRARSSSSESFASSGSSALMASTRG